MSGAGPDRWWVRLLADTADATLPGGREDIFPAARRFREAFSPAREWHGGLAAFREEAAALLAPEADLLGALTTEALAWGYGQDPDGGPLKPPAERISRSRKRRPAARRRTNSPGPAAPSAGRRRVAAAREEPPGRAVARSEPVFATPEAIPGTAAASAGGDSESTPRPPATGSRTGPTPPPGGLGRPDLLSPRARIAAARWWAQRCGDESTAEPAGEEVRTIEQRLSDFSVLAEEDTAIPRPAEPGAAGRQTTAAPAAEAGHAIVPPQAGTADRLPAQEPPYTAEEPQPPGTAPDDWPPPLEPPEAAPAGALETGGITERSNRRRSRNPTSTGIAAAIDTIELRTSRGGSLGRIPADMEPSSPTDWPPPLERPEVPPAGALETGGITERSNRRRSRNRTSTGIQDPGSSAAAADTIELRTSRGGSLGRIPVDMDPARPTESVAAARDERLDQEEAEQTRWLTDDDGLAEELHRLLRRQARRRGIEVS